MSDKRAEYRTSTFVVKDSSVSNEVSFAIGSIPSCNYTPKTEAAMMERLGYSPALSTETPYTDIEDERISEEDIQALKALTIQWARESV